MKRLVIHLLQYALDPEFIDWVQRIIENWQ